MSLDRFKSAQASPESGFATAIGELSAGEKRSHWIWYILPQLAGLGRSSTAQFYGLRDPAEACEYLKGPLLRERLHAAAEAVATHLERGITLEKLMGGTTDAAKTISCLTLFEGAASRVGDQDMATLCARVLDPLARDGQPRCAYTLGELASAKA